MSFKLWYRISNSLKLAIIGMTIYYIFIAIAMLNFPNYDPLTMTISMLGTKSSSSFFFTIGILVVVGTMFYLLVILSPIIQDLFHNQIRKFKWIFVIYSSMLICFIGVVIFPSSGNTSTIHYIIAVALFILMAVGTSWTSKLAHQVLPNWNKRISELGYICSASVVSLFFLLLV
ncbi:MAG: DUF998 domain-containing protein, partial [Candidatus Hodarchaeales archaeon]